MTTPRSLSNCLAPAKLNLFLHVTGRRADGYHLLQTVFQLLDHGDRLHFTLRDDGVLRRMNPFPGVSEDEDLVLRAARLLKQQGVIRGCAAAGTWGADIALEKCLPMGGGLGGGSSDAATTLIGLNHLWQAGLTREQLMELGVQLGADVPFFLFGHNAFAEGIGEQMQAVETPDCWYVVIEPGVMVPTPAIFSAKDLTRDTKHVTIADFSSSPTSRFGKNDLQEVAASLYPEIADAIEWLRAHGAARMTGSGACVFCAMETEHAAQQVVQSVPTHWKAWSARALRQHPMAAFLSNQATT